MSQKLWKNIDFNGGLIGPTVNVLPSTNICLWFLNVAYLQSQGMHCEIRQATEVRVNTLYCITTCTTRLTRFL